MPTGARVYLWVMDLIADITLCAGTAIATYMVGTMLGVGV